MALFFQVNDAFFFRNVPQYLSMSLIHSNLFLEADSEVANPVPLNHNAAHHKIAVRPKRNHGLPRRRVKQVMFKHNLKHNQIDKLSFTCQCVLFYVRFFNRFNTKS